MKGFGLSPALARSASVFAIAAGLIVPGAALAQAGNSAPADAQQGTPQQNTAPAIAGTPEQGATATNSVPEGAPQTAGVTTQTAGDEIVVTGIRASLERSIAIKRTSTGVVDAISAEDIGKFPDTNLAESLQRITGVSINRVNGEGAQVTVRGFGPGYNLVTLNGRTLASSSNTIVGGDGNADGAQGTSRSFDFDNLASEGVKTLEVYKTGRAAVPSGGIGAAINVITRRPLDSNNSGLTGSIGGKAYYDTSVSDCIKCGSKVTPEVTGFASWANPDQNFGVSLFGSYQLRHFSAASTGGNGWNIIPYSAFNTSVYLAPGAKVTGAPTDPNALVGVPNDSRSDFSESRRERINGQATVEFKPTDRVTLTANALFAQNRQAERRSDSSNWFNRPFDEVRFDGNSVVNSAVYLHETINGTKDGPGSENQYRATKNRLTDYGLNGQWELTDNFTWALDGHYSTSKSQGDNPNGASSTLTAFAGKGITDHSVDYSSGVPVMLFNFNDTAPDGGTSRGNRNGTLDTGDMGSQVFRQYFATQRQRLKELRTDFGWDLGGGSRFDFGANYRDSNMRSTLRNESYTLGDWGVGSPGDIDRLAPGQIFEFCLPCKFKNLDLQGEGNALKAYRTEDAAKLYNTMVGAYAAQGVTPNVSGNDNRVREQIGAAYAQITWKGDIADHPASLVAGARYEYTKSKSTTIQAVPTAIRWDADNDFTILYGGANEALKVKNKYNNLLPSMDFQIELRRNLIGRFSFSRTLARTDYSNLFASTTVGGPNRPTAIGGVVTATQQNPSLIPLVSDNFDLSLEWYYKPDSYVSVGFFEKRVQNFVGTTIRQGSLFGLRDATTGAAGTRSGQALAALQNISGADLSDKNLFTLTALIDQTGSVQQATQQFLANFQNGALTQQFVDDTLKAYNVTANSNDPLYTFSITQPINSRDAKLWGFEIAGQHFFGDTGIGVSGAYTLVRGNVGIDNGADPNVDQFALVGLSDTANATIIYDKYGISARLAYNWRGKFLSQLNRDSFHSPAYTRAYGQLDLNISYDITPKIAESFEAINLTEESVRTFGRTYNQIFFAQDLRRRFLFGARYRF